MGLGVYGTDVNALVLVFIRSTLFVMSLPNHIKKAIHEYVIHMDGMRYYEIVLFGVFISSGIIALMWLFHVVLF